MTKEAKIKLLKVILNAGIKGTDREMLDNLKAVIKAIGNEGELANTPLESVELPNNPLFNDSPAKFKDAVVVEMTRKKPGRPKKR